MRFSIYIDPVAADELRRLRKYDRIMIVDAMDRFLAWEPARPQGSRIKQLNPPAVSQFRLRVGDFRVYYDVDVESREVYVMRIRAKGSRATSEVIHDEDN